MTLKVGFTELPNVSVEKMEIVESEDYEIGQCVGYRCQECGEADETLTQIWHKPDCPLAGEHGRTHYDAVDLGSASDGRRAAELDPEHPLWVVKSAETDRGDDVYNEDIVAIRCRCGAADDDAFEIVHDAECPLADECAENRTDIEDLQDIDEELLADGGE